LPESDVTDVAARIGLGEEPSMRGLRIVATVATAAIVRLGTAAKSAAAIRARCV
jgi:hypothetical protein